MHIQLNLDKKIFQHWNFERKPKKKPIIKYSMILPSIDWIINLSFTRKMFEDAIKNICQTEKFHNQLGYVNGSVLDNRCVWWKQTVWICRTKKKLIVKYCKLNLPSNIIGSKSNDYKILDSILTVIGGEI